MILVTSAIHMKRAELWFHHYGFNTLPAPTDFLIKRSTGNTLSDWGLNLEKIEFMNKAIHEQVGILYAKYKIRKNE